MKKRKIVKERYTTVGVRFAADPRVVYTYRVRRNAKLKPGEEVVADTPRGPAVAFVVRVDKTPQDNWPYTYKFIDRRTVAI